MFYTFLLLALFLSPVSFALTGLETVIDTFINQVAESEPIVQDAISNFQGSYNNLVQASGKFPSCQKIDFQQSSDHQAKQSPIAKIVYGHVSANNLNEGSCNLSDFKSVGYDNIGMFVLEVQFKPKNENSQISPLLDGKNILFIASGSLNMNESADFPIIFTNTNGKLDDQNSMSVINSFICLNKQYKCTGNVTGKNPRKGCSLASRKIVQENLTGHIVNSNENSTNLFTYSKGPLFYLCADKYADNDTMAEFSAD